MAGGSHIFMNLKGGAIIGAVFFYAIKRGGRMNQEQFEELCEYIGDKLTNGEVISSYIGLLYGICNEDIEEVKVAINHFAEEAKKSRG